MRVVKVCLIVCVALIAFMKVCTFLVLNGTQSLPHNAYLMFRWPIIPTEGAYVAFHAPVQLADDFAGLPFVKQVAGLPGDEVKTTGLNVCVHSTCRTAQENMVEAGYLALKSGLIEKDEYFVVGTADDSLDSRYAAVGLIPSDRIIGVGFPISFPHWKEIKSWLE